MKRYEVSANGYSQRFDSKEAAKEDAKRIHEETGGAARIYDHNAKIIPSGDTPVCIASWDKLSGKTNGRLV